MTLTDTAMRNSRPGDRLRKLLDGDGRCLSVSTTGHKALRFKYYFDGKEKHLQFGRYPEKDDDYPEAISLFAQIRADSELRTCRCRRHLDKDLRGHAPRPVHDDKRR